MTTPKGTPPKSAPAPQGKPKHTPPPAPASPSKKASNLGNLGQFFNTLGARVKG